MDQGVAAGARVPDSVQITSLMQALGIAALQDCNRRGLDEPDVVDAVYAAMACAAPVSTKLTDANVRAFGRETVYNLREAIEAMTACERRIIEHLAELVSEES